MVNQCANGRRKSTTVTELQRDFPATIEISTKYIEGHLIPVVPSQYLEPSSSQPENAQKFCHHKCDRNEFEDSAIPFDIQSLYMAKKHGLYIGVFVDAGCSLLPFKLQPESEVKIVFLDYFQVEKLEVCNFLNSNQV